MKKILALVLAVVMVAAMFTACGKKGYTAENTEYVIGASGPLTGASVSLYPLDPPYSRHSGFGR